MDITPHVNLLRSLRGERTNYVALIGEGVDNAFDAGASYISVTVSDEKVELQDDGVGITRDRIGSVFSLGDHGAMSTTQLGRFGVGIKSQAVNAGDVFRVASVSRSGRIVVEVNWRQILKTGQWKIDDPKWLPVLVTEKTGTTISISELRHSPRINRDKTLDDLALRFYPAIADGKSIHLNGRPVTLLSEPAMTDIVDRHFSLSGGRSAHLRAGILAEPSKLNKVHVAYKHRVIMPASTLGCGEYGGLTKMFARLRIDGPWHLAKFKDDLTDEREREELEEAVAAALAPILEKCSSASMSARINKVAHLLNEMVPPELAPARPRQNKPREATGTKAKRSGTVDEDKSDDGGPAKSKRPPRDSLLITFDGSAEEDGIGAFEKGSKTQPHRVNLSKDDPFIAELLEHRDEAFGARCLLAIALSLFEEGRQSANQELQFMSFGLRIAKQLSIQEEPGRISTAGGS